MAIDYCCKAVKVIFILINGVLIVFGIGQVMAGIAIKINILPFDALQLLNTLQVVEINLGDILNTLSSSMVAIGVLLVISGVLGCLGTWFESKCLIILYALLMVVVFVMEIGIVFFMFRIKDVIGCCDENSFADNTNAFVRSPWCIITRNCQKVTLPKTCCQRSGILNIAIQCPATANSLIYNEKGCFDRMEHIILTYSNSISGNLFAVIATQMFAVVFIIALYKSRTRTESFPV
ncbi:tetraspanin-18-like isoform X1 [Crassostrea angulata]|uniref:tetraspanin-18-like isoform X1 n=1 Tax=Magallana angulata TaxID=2784310 RepID=UPI0022B0B237|nr:tetraspanin-18-like isoform X1 [Crassostrea angulata]